MVKCKITFFWQWFVSSKYYSVIPFGPGEKPHYVHIKMHLLLEGGKSGKFLTSILFRNVCT